MPYVLDCSANMGGISIYIWYSIFIKLLTWRKLIKTLFIQLKFWSENFSIISTAKRKYQIIMQIRKKSYLELIVMLENLKLFWNCSFINMSLMMPLRIQIVLNILLNKVPSTLRIYLTFFAKFKQKLFGLSLTCLPQENCQKLAQFELWWAPDPVINIFQSGINIISH